MKPSTRNTWFFSTVSYHRWRQTDRHIHKILTADWTQKQTFNTSQKLNVHLLPQQQTVFALCTTYCSLATN